LTLFLPFLLSRLPGHFLAKSWVAVSVVVVAVELPSNTFVLCVPPQTTQKRFDMTFFVVSWLTWCRAYSFSPLSPRFVQKVKSLEAHVSSLQLAASESKMSSSTAAQVSFWKVGEKLAKTMIRKPRQSCFWVWNLVN